MAYLPRLIDVARACLITEMSLNGTLSQSGRSFAASRTL